MRNQGSICQGRIIGCRFTVIAERWNCVNGTCDTISYPNPGKFVFPTEKTRPCNPVCRAFLNEQRFLQLHSCEISTRNIPEPFSP